MIAMGAVPKWRRLPWLSAALEGLKGESLAFTGGRLIGALEELDAGDGEPLLDPLTNHDLIEPVIPLVRKSRAR